MATKMAATCQFALVDTLTYNVVTYHPIPFKFNILIIVLQSNSRSSLNMGFVRQMTTKMADKWPPLLSIYLWTLYLSHLLLDFCQIAYMDYFNQTLAQVPIWALSDNQDGHQNGRQVSNLVICHPISSKFHIWTTSIKLLFMFEYGFCPMNSNQDCHQTARYPLFTATHYAGPFVGVRLF